MTLQLAKSLIVKHILYDFSDILLWQERDLHGMQIEALYDGVGHSGSL